MSSDPSQSSVAAPRIAVDVRRFPWIRRLAADYAFDFASVSRFFVANPAERASWRGVIARTQAFDRPRADVASLLAAQQARRHAPAEARASAERLRDTRTVAVLTGQQAGLFGGPLFTLLKALTALKVAREIEATHGTPAVTIFWVDAEDHDWDEVSSCTVLDGELHPRRIALAPPPGAGEVPVASLVLDGGGNREGGADDSGLAGALDALEAALPASEFTPSVVASLREAYRPGRGMADAFARWMETLLGRYGLIVFDSSDPASKALLKPVFSRELEAPGRTSQLAAQAGADLERLGYHAQVAAPAGPALFHVDRRREAIRHEGARYVIGGASYQASELVARVTSHPSAFSPNVLLRPIVEDTLFPTVCYIAGPSELAYLAQLRGVYEHFGVPMPLYYPRASATILDSAAARFLARYEVPIEAFHTPGDGALNHLLESQLPPGVDATFQDAVHTVDERMNALAAAVPAIDPTLEGAARSTLGRMQHDLKALHGKIIQAAKRRDETLRRQFERVRAQAFPGGQPQERAIGTVSFLARYGPVLVDRLDDTLPLDLGHHWVVTM